MFRVANPIMGWGYGPHPSDDDVPLYPFQDFSSPDAPTNTWRGSIPEEDLLFEAPRVYTQPVYRAGRNPRAGLTRHPAYSHPHLAQPAFLPPDPAYLRQDHPSYDLTLLPNPAPSHQRPRVIGRAPVVHPPYDLLYDDDDDDDDVDGFHERFLAAAVPMRRLEPAVSKYRGGAAASPPLSHAASSISQGRRCPAATSATPAATAAAYTPSAISNDEYDDHSEQEHLVPGPYEAETGPQPRRHHQATSSTDPPRQRQQGPQHSQQHSRAAQYVSSRPVWFFDPSSGLCFLATAPSAVRPPAGSGGRTNIPATTTTTTTSQPRGKLRQGQPGAYDLDTMQQQQQQQQQPPPAARTAEVAHPAADQPRPASPEAPRAACAGAGAGAASRPTRIRVQVVDSSGTDNHTPSGTPAAATAIPVTYRPGSKAAPSSSSSSGAAASSSTCSNRSRADTHPFLERQDSTAIVMRPSMEVALSRGPSAVLPSAAEAGVADAFAVPVTSTESAAGAAARGSSSGGRGGAGGCPFGAAAVNAATAAAAASTTSMFGCNGSHLGSQSRAGSTMTKSQAARTIQRWWRGWRLWRHQAALRQLVTVAGQLRAAAGSFYAYMGATAANITSRQQLEINELAMRVILRLDSMEGLPPEFRALRKHLTARALRLQDEVAAAYTASSARPAVSRANMSTVETLSAAATAAVLTAAAAVAAAEATVAAEATEAAEAAVATVATPSAVAPDADRATATSDDGDAVPTTAHVESSPSDDSSAACSSEPPSPVLSPLSSSSPPPSPVSSSPSQHEESEVDAPSVDLDQAATTATPDGSPTPKPARDEEAAEEASASNSSDAVTPASFRASSSSMKDYVAADSTVGSAPSPSSSACPIPFEATEVTTAPTSPAEAGAPTPNDMAAEAGGPTPNGTAAEAGAPTPNDTAAEAGAPTPNDTAAEAGAPTALGGGVEGSGRRPDAYGVYVGGGGFGGYLRKRPSAGEVRQLRRCGVGRTASPSAATAAVAMTKQGRMAGAEDGVGLCGDGKVAADERQMGVGAQPTVVVRLVVAGDGVERGRDEGLMRMFADVGVQTE